MKSLLPIGSVVLLEGGERRLMICGRIQTDVNTDKSYDYSGCLYPEGIINSDQLYLFNHENISAIFFIGFQDAEEIMYKKFIEEKIGEATTDDAK